MLELSLTLLWIAFLCSLAATIVLGLQFKQIEIKRLGKLLVPPREDMFDLELAGELNHARAIIRSWHAVDWPVLKNLALDMAWIPCYSAALFFGCLLAARPLPGILGAIGPYVAIGGLVAGICDYGENTNIFLTLRDFSRNPNDMREWPPRAVAWFARMKFRLVTSCLIYAALGGIVALIA